MVGKATTAASALPSGLAQSLEHVSVIFRPVPGHARADIHVERRRRDRDSLLQRSFRSSSPTELAECRGKPAAGERKIRVCADGSWCRPGCGWTNGAGARVTRRDGRREHVPVPIGAEIAPARELGGGV